MFNFINFIGIKGLLIGIACFSLGFSLGWFGGKFIGKSIEKKIAYVEQLENALEIKEKHEKIRNNRPDNDALIKRLLEGSF